MVKLFARPFLALTIPVGALLSQSGGSPTPTTDVPVAKVMLFSSGVGYFEHAGSVRGNGATELRFKTSQINDILKSIVLQDQDGGRVGTISYPSQDPLGKTLKSFQVDITQNPSLAQLLNQLRGARVTVQSQAEKLTGTILGVETSRKSTERGEPVEVATLNLISGANVRAVALSSITNLSLDDPQLEEELTKALAALALARDQDKKPVTINFSGVGDRRVRIGYVVETPIWKTSYRLLLEGKGTPSKLQGWAIVENQTESDWNGVSLSLVSGRPMSFMMDLYQPLYATRPTVVPELFAGLMPQIYDGATAKDRARVAMLAAASPAPARDEMLRKSDSVLRESRQGGQMNNAITSRSFEMDAAGSVQAIASGGSLGALFQYTVGNVTLPRQRSAMLPIITDSIEIERLSIYNASVLKTNPLNGVRMKNTTGKHLLQGPVTVLDMNSYAGDARIDDIPPGQERLLSYGIDLDMLVDASKNSQTASVVSAKIVKGLLIVERKNIASQEYSADNKSTKDKQLVIEHPIRQGWKLVDGPKPVETTPALYRFKGNAVAGKVTTLTIREEVVNSETIAMLPADVGALLYYSRTGEIPRDVRDAIGKAIRLKQAVIDLERQIASRSQQINDITLEQTRIRENMKTVSQGSQYYTRLLTKLNEQESSIEGLQKERTTLTTARDSARRELEDYLGTLTVGASADNK
jgi:hypothetical protein